MTAGPILHLSDSDLDALAITYAEVIGMLETVLQGASQGRVWSAPKSVIQTDDGRYMMATLAAMDDPPLLATKSLVLNAANSDVGLPQINGTVTLLSSVTGLPVATIDGNWITGLRTAGLSALAAKHMARPDSETLGFVGTGLQARQHLRAFAEMFPLKRIKIAGRGQPNIDALVDMARQLHIKSEVCTAPKEAIVDADIVVTSLTHTSVAAPFLDAATLKQGAFLTSVDLGAPWFPDGFGQLDRVIIDDVAQESTLPNKLVPAGAVTGDLSDLVAGTQAGRLSQQDRGAFVFRGHALGDLAGAALAYLKFNAQD